MTDVAVSSISKHILLLQHKCLIACHSNYDINYVNDLSSVLPLQEG